jgi:hypothetical protein
MASTEEAMIPASSPIHGEPNTTAALVAINADINNLPSRPISTTPERSANRPVIDAKIRGIQTRTDASNVNTVLRKISLILSPQLVLKNVLELVYINTQGHHKKE